MSIGHAMTGGVSTTVTVWLQRLLLPQASVNNQDRVMTCGHIPLVTVAETLVTLVQQLLRTLGVPKSHAEPH